MEKKSYSPEDLALIRVRCAEKADDAAFDQMIYLAQTYGLDPLLKEIWCVTDNKGNHRIQVARDGFLKIANLHPEFDGLHSDVVHEGDFYALNADGTVQHQYGMQRGAIIGGYCLAFRKDRKIPAYFFAPFKEYLGPSKIWQTFPTSMIIKVAESMALKRAFALSGLTSAEELDVADTGKELLASPSPEQTAYQPLALAAGIVAQGPAENAAAPSEVLVQQQAAVPVMNADIQNFMAQANGAEPPLPAVPVTNKQRATIADLLSNPKLSPEKKVEAENFFNNIYLSKEAAQAGIDRLTQLIYSH